MEEQRKMRKTNNLLLLLLLLFNFNSSYSQVDLDSIKIKPINKVILFQTLFHFPFIIRAVKKFIC